MKKLKFSLIQLVISIVLVLVIAFFLINKNSTTDNNPRAIEPQITIPFQEIKIK